MKKLVLTFAIIFTSVGLFAQNNPNTITVSGIHKYDVAPEYTAKMILSLTNVYYDAQTMSMPELKSSYYDKLAKAGIAKDRLKEDDLSYALMGYDKEGTIIEYKTTSLDKMKDFLMVKALGVTKSDASLNAELTEEEMANYAKSAFDDAKKKAQAIANKIGRKVGKAVYISDTNTNKIYDSLYYGTKINDREYYISVSFELL